MRTLVTSTLVVIICCFSFSAQAQLKKVDAAFGYKNYKLGTDRSEFTAILEPIGEDGYYKVKLGNAPELQHAFGDSVLSVYFKFNDANKLDRIKFKYPNVEQKMEPEASNVLINRIQENLAAEFGKHTNKRGFYPNFDMYWSGKKTYVLYTVNRTMGFWLRWVNIVMM